MHDFQNPVVHAVDDIQRAGRVDKDAMRLKELCFKRRPVQACVAAFAGPGNLHHDAFSRLILADHVILGVRNNYVPSPIDAQVLGPVERGFQGRHRSTLGPFFPLPATVRMLPLESTSRKVLPPRSRI